VRSEIEDRRNASKGLKTPDRLTLRRQVENRREGGGGKIFQRVVHKVWDRLLVENTAVEGKRSGFDLIGRKRSNSKDRAHDLMSGFHRTLQEYTEGTSGLKGN